MTLRLTGAQVTRIREAANRYSGGLASRGATIHIAAEELAEDVLDIVAETMPDLVKWREKVPKL